MRLVNSYASIAVDIDCSPNPSVKPAAISQVCCVSENTNHSKSDFGLCFDACLGDFFKVVGRSVSSSVASSSKEFFYTKSKTSEKNGSSIGKKLSLFYNNPSIIADQCHELLIVTFSRISIPEKNVSLQLSQHPQVKDSKDSNLLNGCDIYRTSAPRNYEKKARKKQYDL